MAELPDMLSVSSLERFFRDMLEDCAEQGLSAGDVSYALYRVAKDFRPRSQYDGWERIHDNNKAEGRPVGNQWSANGVDYSQGYKVRITR